MTNTIAELNCITQGVTYHSPFKPSQKDVKKTQAIAELHCITTKRTTTSHTSSDCLSPDTGVKGVGRYDDTGNFFKFSC